MAKRRRRGREFWTPLINEFEAGGGSEEYRGFADRHGVRCGSFRGWLYKLRSETQGRRRPRPSGRAAAVTAPWLLCLLPRWPKHNALELAPVYWRRTIARPEVDRALAGNVLRQVALGLRA
jgi:hypothetical protein